MSHLTLTIAASRYLLGSNREDAARKAVAEVNGVSIDDPIVQETIEELAVGLRDENEVCLRAIVPFYLLMTAERVAKQHGLNAFLQEMCFGNEHLME